MFIEGSADRYSSEGVRRKRDSQWTLPSSGIGGENQYVECNACLICQEIASRLVQVNPIRSIRLLEGNESRVLHVGTSTVTDRLVGDTRRC